MYTTWGLRGLKEERTLSRVLRDESAWVKAG